MTAWRYPMPDNSPLDRLASLILAPAKWLANHLVLLLVLLLLGISFAAPAVLSLSGSQEVVAYWEPITDTTAAIRGRVVRSGEEVEAALVWAILRDDQGNRAATTADTTDASGEFALTPVRTRITDSPVINVAVFARSLSGKRPMSEEVLMIADGAQLRKVSISFWWVAYIPGIFLASILLAFVDVEPQNLKHKYYAGLVLSLLFTVAMITAISLGMSFVSSHDQHDEILSLGFGSLFHDTYVPEHQREWILSLTSPPELGADTVTTAVADTTSVAITQPQPARGFGAPLWVLLLGVIGASLRTVQIVVKEITQRPEYEKALADALADANKGKELRSMVREHMEDIVLHQFYILFAPLGAIFVYQALVAGDAAGNSLTVAVAALGAGASLNALLKKASEPEKNGNGGGPSAPVPPVPNVP
jgi:hypothetical protein